MIVANTSEKSKLGLPYVDSEEVRFFLTRPILDALDQWAGTRGDPTPSLSEAVRRALVPYLTALGYFR